MKRTVKNRMYPSIKGGPRKLWDPKDVIAIVDGKVYAYSEGFKPEEVVAVPTSEVNEDGDTY